MAAVGLAPSGSQGAHRPSQIEPIRGQLWKSIVCIELDPVTDKSNLVSNLVFNFIHRTPQMSVTQSLPCPMIFAAPISDDIGDEEIELENIYIQIQVSVSNATDRQEDTFESK